jgi:hypothetical protein
MSYQFAHLNVYSRKADKTGVNTDFVFGEVMRVAGCCDHVEHPEEPVLAYGMSVADLKRLHDERAGEARTTNAKGQSRSIRKDQKTLVTVILSHPGDADGVASVDEWQARSIEWLKAKYGDDLKTVVRHNDESYPHLHAYILPAGADMKAAEYHPGMSAKSAIVGRGASIEENRLGDRAYRQAMREWQDDYYDNVGRVCGLTRIGPGGRRLSKAAHNAEKLQAKRLREAMSYENEIKEKQRSLVKDELALNIQASKLAEEQRSFEGKRLFVAQVWDVLNREIRRSYRSVKKLRDDLKAEREKGGKWGEFLRSMFGKSLDSIKKEERENGIREGRSERQNEVDRANDRAVRLKKERDRARNDLKNERDDRAKDFVLPKNEHTEYARWRMEQKTKNAPAGPERQRQYGHGFMK